MISKELKSNKKKYRKTEIPKLLTFALTFCMCGRWRRLRGYSNSSSALKSRHAKNESNSYDVPIGFVPPPPHLRQCLAVYVYVVALGWQLLNIRWFILFFLTWTDTHSQSICRSCFAIQPNYSERIINKLCSYPNYHTCTNSIKLQTHISMA